MEHSDRYQKGLEKLKETDGEAGEKNIIALQEISPDLGKFIVEYAYGEIYTRAGLDLKSKEIAIVSALTSMGTAAAQLKVHINGALNTGSTINEVKEVILQMAVSAGFPGCLSGMNVLKEVLKERKESGIKDDVGNTSTETTQTDRLKSGEQELIKLDSLQVDRLKSVYNDISPELVKLMLEFGYADIFSRDSLES